MIFRPSFRGIWAGGSPARVLAALGNSFTKGTVYGDIGLADELNALASDTGANLAASQYVVDNTWFGELYDDAACTTFINGQDWTDAILQGHSTAGQAANFDTHRDFGVLLAGRFLTKDINTRIWLWQTSETDVTTLAESVAFYAALKTAIEAAYPAARVEILRTGEGFYYMGCDPVASPVLRTWRVDPVHPSETGSTFNALHHFAKITRRSISGAIAGTAYAGLGKTMIEGDSVIEDAAYAWALADEAIPVISTQPASDSVNEGEDASFSVVAISPDMATYQWLEDGVEIPGATSSTLELVGVALADNGKVYSVVVTNALGSVTSANATLSVGASGMTPVYINFMRPSFSPGSPAADGYYWNTINGEGADSTAVLQGNVYSSFKDRTNVATGLALRIVYSVGGGSSNNTTNVSYLGIPELIAEHYWVSNAGEVQDFRIEGLTPGQSYRIEFGAARGAGTQRMVRVQLVGATTGTPVDYDAGWATEPTSIYYADMVADASGYISVKWRDWTPTTLAFGYLGFLRISHTP